MRVAGHRVPLSVVIAIAVPVAGGIIDMRMAISRIEEKVADVDHRVTRIESKADARSLASTSPED